MESSLPLADPYKVTVAQWRSRVAPRSSPPSSPTHDLSSIDVTPPTLHSSSGNSLPDSPVDAPATISARPSLKRCRSLAVLVPLATSVPGALSPIHADLLPPCKRIRDAADIDTDTAAAEAAETKEVDVGVEVGIGSDREDKAEEGDRGTVEIEFDKVSDIKSAKRE
nr:hypothetical protein [Tanacetum cinerariifolium]